MNERNLKILGWIGTMLSVIMYVSYVPQILGNLHGNKTFFLQPLAAAINCTIWTSYGLLKEKRDSDDLKPYHQYSKKPCVSRVHIHKYVVV